MIADKNMILFGVGAGTVVLIAAAYIAKKGLPVLGSAVNPLNPNNAFISGANAVTESLTGDPSFGGWLAEIFSSDVRAANEAMRAPVILGGGGGFGYGEVGMGYDVAMGSGAPVFQETPGGAVTGLIFKRRG